MRVTSKPSRGGSDIDSTMTPMIDVVFLLLIFFVWTSSFQAVEAILPSRLAAETGGPSVQPIDITPDQDFDKIVIHVDWLQDAATWRINESPVASAEQLQASLLQIHEVQPQAPIVVDPNDNSPMALVIQAYDLARLAGFTKISLAADLTAAR